MSVPTREQERSTAPLAAPRLVAPPLALYVHMPWCVRKCPYCDFNSHAAPARLPQREYVDALIDDLMRDLPLAEERPLISIFFGGGTPSLFAPAEIARFLERVRASIPVDALAEITLEANPGTIERGMFADYRAAGINRVSLGAQSFNARHLHALGRIHEPHDIARAVDELVRCGLDNFNLDLMYALPGQSVDEALADIEAALALAPSHVSHYQLTLEPGTVFCHRPPPLPDADTAWEMQLRCQERLAQAGYEQYEVSAYARGGRRSVHNLNYWRFGDYLGLGAGAHGKLTRVAERTVLRTSRTKQPRTYLESAPDRRDERHVVPPGEVPFEFMLNVLRLREGFDTAQFESRTGQPFATVLPALEQARGRGLLERDAAGAWRPTELGYRFLNDLQALFL
jgi:putative oxygen-independent coproporphyrinogen III oxidase